MRLPSREACSTCSEVLYQGCAQLGCWPTIARWEIKRGDDGSWGVESERGARCGGAPVSVASRLLRAAAREIGMGGQLHGGSQTGIGLGRANGPWPVWALKYKLIFLVH